MYVEKRKPFVLLLFATMTVLLSLASARGQENTEPPGGPKPKSEDVEQLKAKVEQLQLRVEKQQRALEALQKRLDAPDGKPNTTATASPSKADAVEPAPAVSEAKQDTKNAPAQNKEVKNSTAQSQTQTGEKSGLVAGW